MMMKRSIQRYVPLASLSLALWLAWGCEGNDAPGADLPPVSVSLVTKTSSGEVESTASARRVVVFDEAGECVQNYSFVPGSGTLSLDPGTYRMVTLSVPAGLGGLPDAGTTAGITPELALSFDAKASITPFSLSELTEETLSAASVYTATLLPATSLLSLRVSGLPEGSSAEFTLLGMYASVGLDGTYAGSLDYPVSASGETVCFPTPGAATLSYSVDGGEPRSLPVGRTLEAGNRLTLELAWGEELREISVSGATVMDWIPGNDTGEAGDAK